MIDDELKQLLNKSLGILMKADFAPQCFCSEPWVRGHAGSCGEWWKARDEAVKLLGHYGVYNLRPMIKDEHE